jgi:hypothetical protein
MENRTPKIALDTVTRFQPIGSPPQEISVVTFDQGD